MILFFVDDSGNTGASLVHPVEQVHWLVAVGVDESLVRALDRAVYLCCCRHFGTGAASAPDFEVKGADLFSGRRVASKLSPQQRIACYQELLALLEPHHARLFVRGIHKARLAQRASTMGSAPGHPYDRGFQYLIEAIDRWLTRQDGELRGLMVADEQQEVERRMVHQFNQWAHYGTTSGYRATDITRLLPALHYVRSVDSRLIQLADCVAFLRNRYEKLGGAVRTTSDEAIATMWSAHCAAITMENRIWP